MVSIDTLVISTSARMIKFFALIFCLLAVSSYASSSFTIACPRPLRSRSTRNFSSLFAEELGESRQITGDLSTISTTGTSLSTSTSGNPSNISLTLNPNCLRSVNNRYAASSTGAEDENDDKENKSDDKEDENGDKENKNDDKENFVPLHFPVSSSPQRTSSRFVIPPQNIQADVAQNDPDALKIGSNKRVASVFNPIKSKLSRNLHSGNTATFIAMAYPTY